VCVLNYLTSWKRVLEKLIAHTAIKSIPFYYDVLRCLSLDHQDGPEMVVVVNYLHFAPDFLFHSRSSCMELMSRPG
jgi:hypothetical protein